MPFGGKDFVTINAADIISIGLWKRQAKIAAVIVGASGALAIGLALAMQGPQHPGVAEGNLIGFMLTLYSVVILWYEIIDIPAIILSEKLSIRSQKKGYEFYIDPNPPVQLRHRFRIL